jgi:outer membrane protein assembly factor BamE (lipoprotein component of BamABCDE complex)
MSVDDSGFSRREAECRTPECLLTTARRGDRKMRTQLLLAPALFTAALLVTSARAENVRGADQAIEKSIKDLKVARDSTKNAADKERLLEAIAALEKVAAKKGPGKEDVKNKVYTRAAFKQLVVGKTKEQVKALLGPPTKTWELNDADYSVGWHYKNRTKDPDAEEIDPDANILFDAKGVAVSVDFFHIPF